MIPNIVFANSNSELKTLWFTIATQAAWSPRAGQSNPVHSSAVTAPAAEALSTLSAITAVSHEESKEKKGQQYRLVFGQLVQDTGSY